jgi:ketosteroid isomerase-like protein
MISRRLLSALAASALVMASACQPETPTDQSVPPDPLPDFDALFAERYMKPFNTKDIPAWLDAFAEDAVGMHNGLPPLVGRDAIRGFGEAVRDGFELAEIDARVDEVQHAGDWVYTRGKAGNQGAPSGQQQGKFLLLWERQADGDWKIILDMGNSNGRPPAPPTEAP